MIITRIITGIFARPVFRHKTELTSPFLQPFPTQIACRECGEDLSTEARSLRYVRKGRAGPEIGEKNDIDTAPLDRIARRKAELGRRRPRSDGNDVRGRQRWGGPQHPRQAERAIKDNALPTNLETTAAALSAAGRQGPLCGVQCRSVRSAAAQHRSTVPTTRLSDRSEDRGSTIGPLFVASIDAP